MTWLEQRDLLEEVKRLRGMVAKLRALGLHSVANRLSGLASEIEAHAHIPRRVA